MRFLNLRTFCSSLSSLSLSALSALIFVCSSSVCYYTAMTIVMSIHSSLLSVCSSVCLLATRNWQLETRSECEWFPMLQDSKCLAAVFMLLLPDSNNIWQQRMAAAKFRSTGLINKSQIRNAKTIAKRAPGANSPRH